MPDLDEERGGANDSMGALKSALRGSGEYFFLGKMSEKGYPKASLLYSVGQITYLT